MNAITTDSAPVARSSLSLVLALGAVYLIWGSTYYGIRIGLEGYPPFLMGGLRFIAAGTIRVIFFAQFKKFTF